MRKKLFALIVVGAIFSFLVGCSEPPTQAPTQPKVTKMQGQEEKAASCDYEVRSDDSGTEALVGPGQKIFRKSDAVNGAMSPFILQGDSVLINGWGFDRQKKVVPDGFLLFINNKCVALVKPTERPDVASHFKNPDLAKTGFSFAIPKYTFQNKSPDDLRIVILTADGLMGDVDTSKAAEGAGGKLWKKGGGPR